jgi:ornithine decarboxylase
VLKYVSKPKIKNMPPLQPDQEIELLAEARLLNHATPFFYTSKDVLRKNYELFTGLFDNSEIYYALKANSDPKILTYLDSLEAGFEAASWFEASQLLDLGVSPNKIVYGTSIKPADHIRQCFESGVKRFAADSKEEIQKLAKYAPGSKVYIRTIVDDAGSVFMMSERFGAPVETVKDLVLYAKKLGLKTYGLSFYVGSQATQVDMWSRGVMKVKPIIEALYAEGVTLEVLNIGGGFPVRYDNHSQPPRLHDIVVATHNALHTLPYNLKIIMEPGRAIVASSTVLVAEVIARNDRAGKPWLCLDAGIYNALYEAMIHQGSTGFPVYPLNPPTEPVDIEHFTLAGPTGDSLDVISRDVPLPAYTDIGDRLIFENAGAYSLALASRFNGFPAPLLYIGDSAG